MKITAVIERTVPISRYADLEIPPGGLDTSIVAVITDASLDGEPIIGFGFASIGRFAQGGLIRDRFAPRLIEAGDDVADPATGIIDPDRAWAVMMAGEKPGGHGERCVAVGALDMAIWDAAAKAAGLPLWRFLVRQSGRNESEAAAAVPVYAGGGYYFPDDDLMQLRDEMAMFRDLGFTRAKIKIGADLKQDLARIETCVDIMGGAENLAVDAIYSYDGSNALLAAAALAPIRLWWFEDICDPSDFDLLSEVAASYPPPIAAGEATFGVADARNLLRYGGLRPDRDILLFDIAHCYGLPEFTRIVDQAETVGWQRQSFWPHGGHLFTLHAVAALGLGGAEVNPHNFQPLGGLTDSCAIAHGMATPPDLPGIGFEGRSRAYDLFQDLVRKGR